MSNRLDQEREKDLQPKRIKYALEQLRAIGIDVIGSNETTINFIWKDHLITFYPYSGWHSGKTIQDGRGIKKLLKQLK